LDRDDGDGDLDGDLDRDDGDGDLDGGIGEYVGLFVALIDCFLVAREKLGISVCVQFMSLCSSKNFFFDLIGVNLNG